MGPRHLPIKITYLQLCDCTQMIYVCRIDDAIMMHWIKMVKGDACSYYKQLIQKK